MLGQPATSTVPASLGKRGFAQTRRVGYYFYVLISDASKEQLVCNAYTLDCGHPTLKYCSLLSPMFHHGLNSCVRDFRALFFIRSFAPPEYMFQSLQQQGLNFTTDATSRVFYFNETAFLM